MIGVAEEDAGVEIVGQVALRESLDGGLGADRHEDRRLDIPVRRVQYSGAGARDRALGLNLEGDQRTGDFVEKALRGRPDRSC